MQFVLLNDTPQWNVKNNELNWRFCNCTTQSLQHSKNKAKYYYFFFFICAVCMKMNEFSPINKQINIDLTTGR